MSAERVSCVVGDGIAVLTVCNPPVNALSAAVRIGLLSGIERSEADPSVRAILICAAGRTFPAGADIREFAKPPVDPLLPDLCNRIEFCAIPVVAAVHGTVLGGGLELALSAHYRIAHRNTAIGFPEIKLGILPGAGGTQRAPRICGAEPSLKMMLSGDAITAETAHKIGLIDRIADSDLPSAALDVVRQLLKSGQGARPSRDRTEGTADSETFLNKCSESRAALGRKTAVPASWCIVDSVQKAAELPFEQGLAFERACFAKCLASRESAALRHMFFAERTAAKPVDLPHSSPRTIERIAIVGGGTMGVGIATACLNAGLNVQLAEADDRKLSTAIARIGQSMNRSVNKGRISAREAESRLSALDGCVDLAGLSGADMAIEAVFEDYAAKGAVLSELSKCLGSKAVLATNTSYLDVERLERACGRHGHFIGLHFFAPAHIMRLVEVVPTEKSSPDAVAIGFALAKKLGKVPVRSGVCEGFIGNRMLAVYREAADLMLLDGATPYQIDDAVKQFGFAMGIYETQDLSGLDISWSRRKRLLKNRNPQRRYCPLGDRLCEAGWFGQKTKRGYYLYNEGRRVRNDAVLEILQDVRGECGSKPPRDFSAEDIQIRILAAMAGEASRILEDGIAERPSDIDVVKVCGYGFPRWRGGPMHFADDFGIRRLAELIAGWSRFDPQFWRNCSLLRRMADDGATFDSINNGLYHI